MNIITQSLQIKRKTNTQDTNLPEAQKIPCHFPDDASIEYINKLQYVALRTHDQNSL